MLVPSHGPGLLFEYFERARPLRAVDLRSFTLDTHRLDAADFARMWRLPGLQDLSSLTLKMCRGLGDDSVQDLTGKRPQPVFLAFVADRDTRKPKAIGASRPGAFKHIGGGCKAAGGNVTSIKELGPLIRRKDRSRRGGLCPRQGHQSEV